MEKRTRRPAPAARRRILEAAEKRLIEGGPEAVRVQPLARELGVTDAAIYHHFESRQGLLDALLRHAGRGLKESIAGVVERLDADEIRVAEIADLILDVYERRGYARLALWLRLSGWRERGSGMLLPLAEALHEARQKIAAEAGAPLPDSEDTRLAVVLLNSSLFAEAWVGDAMRRSEGIASDPATRRRYRRWLGHAIERLLLPANESGP